MKFNILIGNALCLFLILINFPVGGYLYSFQEHRSPVKIELVSSKASIKCNSCYYFTRYQNKRINFVPISDWDNYLQYFESKIKLCKKNSMWIFENLPKIKIFASKRCFDFDNDYLLNRTAQYWCNIESIQRKLFINKEHYENIII